MTESIAWITDFKEAFELANEHKKLVLLDFFNPQ